MQGTARRQVFGHVAPLAASAQHIHDAVQHLANVDVSSPPATFGGWDQPLYPRPLFVGQVTRVAQPVPIVPLPVLGRPHRPLANRCRVKNHRRFKEFKPPR